MSLSPTTLSSEEQDQILQTIEMFEVIIQANPQDCQSMEILKDAYLKVGKLTEGLGIGRRLADLYVELQQFSQAMFEYEFILGKDPGNGEVVAAMAELEEKMHQAANAPEPEPERSSNTIPFKIVGSDPEGSGIAAIDLDFQMTLGESGTLIATDRTRRSGELDEPTLVTSEMVASGADGSEALAKFFSLHRIVSEEIISSSLERVHKRNAERPPGSLPVSLIDEICRRGSIELEILLGSIIDKSKFAYIPLEYYDVDRTVVKMLPEHLTVGRLMCPFDLMSRTIMIATANPFDAAAKETAQQLLDYNIQWHLAAPHAIAQVLAGTYKVGSAGPETISFRMQS
jgi:hypothetical protein